MAGSLVLLIVVVLAHAISAALEKTDRQFNQVRISCRLTPKAFSKSSEPPISRRMLSRFSLWITRSLW
jgi:hypothetical protein